MNINYEEVTKGMLLVMKILEENGVKSREDQILILKGAVGMLESSLALEGMLTMYKISFDKILQ